MDGIAAAIRRIQACDVSQRGKDESVFDIMRGVVICIMAQESGAKSKGERG